MTMTTTTKLILVVVQKLDDFDNLADFDYDNESPGGRRLSLREILLVMLVLVLGLFFWWVCDRRHPLPAPPSDSLRPYSSVHNNDDDHTVTTYGQWYE
jgi:hypothetical protein